REKRVRERVVAEIAGDAALAVQRGRQTNAHRVLLLELRVALRERGRRRPGPRAHVAGPAADRAPHVLLHLILDAAVDRAADPVADLVILNDEARVGRVRGDHAWIVRGNDRQRRKNRETGAGAADVAGAAKTDLELRAHRV